MTEKEIHEILENSKNYEIKTTYTGWGWFLFTIIGMSATPGKVEFLDKHSGKVMMTYTDPEILKKFVGR